MGRKEGKKYRKLRKVGGEERLWQGLRCEGKGICREEAREEGSGAEDAKKNRSK